MEAQGHLQFMRLSAAPFNPLCKNILSTIVISPARTTTTRHQSVSINSTVVPKREKDAKKRVVVTGMGLISVHGNDVDMFYQRLLDGESGIGLIDRFDASEFSTRFAGLIRGFRSNGYIDGKNDRRLDDCQRYCIVSGEKALEDAALIGHECSKARMIKVAIGGKSKNLLNHLTSNPPESDSNDFDQWEQEGLVVFSWLIQNIEPQIASNLTEFPTAKSLWEALITTYSSGKDKLQTFDLHVKANEIKQTGMSLEDLWIKMQGIWGEIECRDPNPMKCSTDIITYNKIRSEQKLFQFLNALDRKHDSIKREILRWEPLPSAEEAYATVRKETAHQLILGTGEYPTQQGVAAGLAVTKVTEVEGTVFVAKPYRKEQKVDKSKLKCSKCGKARHTREQCFEIVGNPDWWNNGHKKGGGTTATTVGSHETTTSGYHQRREGFCGVQW